MRQQLIHYLRSYYRLHSLLIKSSLTPSKEDIDDVVTTLESLTDEQVDKLYSTIKKCVPEAITESDNVKNINVLCDLLGITQPGTWCDACPNILSDYCDVTDGQSDTINKQLNEAVLVLLKEILNLDLSIEE